MRGSNTCWNPRSSDHRPPLAPPFSICLEHHRPHDAVLLVACSEVLYSAVLGRWLWFPRDHCGGKKIGSEVPGCFPVTLIQEPVL
jgi:hypothetical protein